MRFSMNSSHSSTSLFVLLLVFAIGFCQQVSLIPKPRFGFGIFSSLFPGFGLGGQCPTVNGRASTCTDFFTCTASGGSSSGKCAFGFKVCCLPRSPASTTIPPVTTVSLLPPIIGNLVKDGAELSDSLTITRRSAAFCQVRVDFTQFTLDRVDGAGNCPAGVRWTASGQRDTNVPVLCGFNTGQHLYLNFDAAGTPIVLNVVTTNQSNFWNIRTTQIACSDQQNLAPPRCLQFFPNPSGNVRSFGYQDIQDIANTVTFQPANLDYIVCIDRSTSTFNSITWMRDMTTLLSFTITGLTSANSMFLGEVAAANFDGDCTTDFVGISNGRFTNAATQPQTANMFCGNGFPRPVVSTPPLTPFTLRVFTNGFERQPPIPIDIGNVGFSLDYVLS